jgi:1-phosphatidylinositol-3-phosphate 5-kinase
LPAPNFYVYNTLMTKTFMVDQKPLPALPPNPTILSIDANAHRRRLIRHLLSDIHEPGIESKRDGWTSVLEEVLDELGTCLDRSNWLSGIMKARRLRRDAIQRERAEKDAKPPDVAKPKKLIKTHSSSGESHASTDRDPKEVQSSEGSHKAGSSKELPSGPLPTLLNPVGKQLLLCVAPLGSRLPTPTEDSGFAIVPAEINCTFVDGTFTLPDVENMMVLYGNKEWIRQQPLSLPPPLFILTKRLFSSLGGGQHLSVDRWHFYIQRRRFHFTTRTSLQRPSNTGLSTTLPNP